MFVNFVNLACRNFQKSQIPLLIFPSIRFLVAKIGIFPRPARPIGNPHYQYTYACSFARVNTKTSRVKIKAKSFNFTYSKLVDYSVRLGSEVIIIQYGGGGNEYARWRQGGRKVNSLYGSRDK